jgi:acetylglutamate kinase
MSSKTVVIKYGGGAMNDRQAGPVFAAVQGLARLGWKIVLVHGGGPMIDAEMKRQGIPKTTIEGLRVTDAATMKIVEAVLTSVNQDSVAKLKALGLQAENCTPGMFSTQPTKLPLGSVGEIVATNAQLLQAKLGEGIIPVVSSLGKDKKSGHTTNINADTAAAKIAIAMRAEKLTILTNVDGVMRASAPIPQLSPTEAEEYIASGIIEGGMIPKVRACSEAVQAGVGMAHLMNAATMTGGTEIAF